MRSRAGVRVEDSGQSSIAFVALGHPDSERILDDELVKLERIERATKSARRRRRLRSAKGVATGGLGGEEGKKEEEK